MHYGSILLISLALSFSACEDWLDVSPKADVKAEVFYTHESGYNDGLIGIYTLMTTSSSYGRDLTYTYADVLAQYYDHLKGRYGMGSFKYASVYKWESSREESRLSAIWSRAFQAISNANIALKYIDQNKSVFGQEEIFKIYKGEFLALRAYLHFDMLRLFSPSPAKGIDAMSIPYVSIYTSEAQSQLSIKDVVAKIESDLKEAKELMRTVDPYGPNSNKIDAKLSEKLKNRHYRMNYYAVTALLARVYNYIGYKEKALEQATELTGKADGSTSIPKVFSLAKTAANNADLLFNKELIFSINKEDLADATKPYFFNEKKDYYRQYVLSMTTSRKNSIFNAGDLSTPFRDAWISPTVSGSTYALSKYNQQKMIPMLKLSEMFLIAAECSQNSTDALWYLNKIRKHRGLVFITDASKIDKEIYKEYKREFIGEGQLFYFYKRKLYNKIGASDDVEVDVEKVYSIPLPKSEVEFGKVKQ